MKLTEIFASLVRVIAGVPKPSRWHEAEPIATPPLDALPVGHVSAGRFTPKEFKAISKQLQDAGIHFEIECDTSSPGINVDGDTWDRATVELFVPNEHVRAAAKMIENQRLADGHVEKKDA